jgi:hypothetical protein
MHSTYDVAKGKRKFFLRKKKLIDYTHEHDTKDNQFNITIFDMLKGVWKIWCETMEGVSLRLPIQIFIISHTINIICQ